MQNKLEELKKLIEHDQIIELITKNMTCDANIKGVQVSVKPRKKYTAIDIGDGGRYLVENTTGEIYGVKGYGVPNKAHKFGTIDTIYDYHWGGYLARKVSTKRTLTKLLSVVSILAEKGVYIDEQGRLYGGKYGEKKLPDKPKPVKVFSNNRYTELTAELTQAKILGEQAALEVEDSGTCNLDGIFLRLNGFNEDQTVKAIDNSGLGGFKHTSRYFGTGYLISLCVGQAYKREKAAETMYKYLQSLGYDVSHWQQMD